MHRGVVTDHTYRRWYGEYNNPWYRVEIYGADLWFGPRMSLSLSVSIACLERYVLLHYEQKINCNEIVFA